ncbi:MAG TPA: agmatine deiminase family protein [Dokdonella sp.]|uniref:agmatine deiminase family protein n=1 Tax=Dokdonella sp. TaxID=2291710 RepID=UPI0025BCF203|nr:agmatine deiminase family protein [Dokdonella sp.]MBX3692982.1 agmatine deiminase family protein [Dokdonella sp.]MCW5566710.1 agmatine deiminase family protein [Dokdonella sp.]HNR91897.1 agmatine deiminase family protein [Dokdonella sp.]
MRLLAASLVLLAFSAVADAAPREADPAFLATIVDDLPPPLPRGLAAHERGLALPRAPFAPLAPPASVPRAQAEYEANHGILIRWGNFNALHTAMVVPLTTAEPPADVWIVVGNTNQQNSATTVLANAGADLAHVHFVIASTDSVWIRDYGPRFIDDAGRRAIADHTYNRPRPNDNNFPGVFAGQLGETRYVMPLVHGGGNFHLFRNREAFMTRLIVNENPSSTEQEIKDTYLAYQGLDVTLTDPFPSSYDSTQHIDMWMLPLGDDKVLIGEYAAAEGGGVPKAVTDATAALMQSRGYTVHRTPGWRSGGAHYTYTNAVIVNQVALICRFGGSNATRDAEARATFEAAMPDHDIVQVDCSGIIGLSGAIHCIVMHVPDLLLRTDFDGAIPQP